uniref:Uncharacterized protein n=1 Tax=Arundo donax TaxID=35708 RepID=A0A0A9A930_ARUDO
MMQLTRPKI